MPFFLLAKGADDRLSLLSDAVFDSRSEAMAELSRITSDPAFDSWDDEVLVFELGTGAPVLLMRPAAAVADAVIAEPTESPAVEETPEEEAAEDAPEDAAVFEAPEVAEVLSADANLPEGGAVVTEVDEAWAEAVAQTDAFGEEDADVSLKEALLRTASQMESEGIVAPESVGPVEEAAELSEVAADEAPEPEDDVAAPETEISIDTEESTDLELEPAEETGSAEPEGSDETPAWPWDVAAATEVAMPEFELSVFEEPGNDEISLVRAPGDDDTMAAARPVIMGAYSDAESPSPAEETAPAVVEDRPVSEEDEPSGAPEDVDDLSAPVDPASVTELLVEAGAEAEPVAEEIESQDPTAEASGDEISDFILDLETTVPAADTPGYNPDPANLPEMTCNDCVYVETCPRTEGRDPRECGSFQWK